MVRLAVAATMVMGVRHSGLKRLFHSLDMVPMSLVTYAKHMLAVTYVKNCVVTLQEVAIVLVVCFDGWITRCRTASGAAGMDEGASGNTHWNLKNGSITITMSANGNNSTHCWWHGGSSCRRAVGTLGQAPWVPLNHDCVGQGCEDLYDGRVYGNVELKKEEFVTHVAKSLGTALRKLNAD